MSRVVVVPSASVLTLVACLVFLAVRGSDALSCRNPSQQPGTCIPVVDCPDLLAMLNLNPLPDEQRKFLKASQCGYRNNQPTVCCPRERVRLSSSAVVQEDGRDDAPIPANPLIPTLRECGEYIENRIVGGDAMELTEFPWLALLQYTKPTGKVFLCGGSLISARYVLTAAHCVKEPLVTPKLRLTSVRLGEYNTATERDCVASLCSDNPLDIPVEHTLAHKNYNGQDRSNDIALVRLSRSVEYSAWIAPICLPLLSDVITRKNRALEELTVGGWGHTEVGSSSEVKLKVKVPVVPRDNCARIYREVNVRVLSTQLCAGGRQKDACRGDSGGPLVALEEQGAYVNWFLAGIVSNGPTICGQKNWPSLFTDVTKYGAWISRNVKP